MGWGGIAVIIGEIVVDEMWTKGYRVRGGEDGDRRIKSRE